ncbi:putative pyridoxal phosphate-dependent aminotransferase EpsN [compost metagenome]
MSPTALKTALEEHAALNKLPKAVIVVNLYGQSADFDQIMEICNYFGVPIIEDAAESLGATYQGKMSGRFGKFGVFSFNGNKIITTSGGGMLISDDLASLEKAKFLSTQARDHAIHYQHSELGYNYRLSNISAGIGRGQLKVLNDRIIRKREIFQLYYEHLNHFEGIEFMPESNKGISTRWLTVMTLDPKLNKKNTYDLIGYLQQFNIESRPVWKPLHLQPLFNGAKFYPHGGKDVSQHLFNNGVCLPSGTIMTEENQRFVIDQIKGFLAD